MNISSISPSTPLSSNSSSTDNKLEQLRKQIKDLRKEIITINESDTDDKTKKEKVEQIELQIQQLELQIQKLQSQQKEKEDETSGETAADQLKTESQAALSQSIIDLLA